MDQAQVGLWVHTPLRLRIHPQFWEWELPSLLPLLDGSLDLKRPKEIGLLRRLGRLWDQSSWAVHVVAPDLMFGAVPTVHKSVSV